MRPVDVERIELGDVVVAKVGDSTMLHLVKAIDVDRRVVEISGTSATLGWTALDRVFGICARIGGTCPWRSLQDEVLSGAGDVEPRPAPTQRRRRDRGEEDVGEDQHQPRRGRYDERVGCADPSVQQCHQHGLAHPRDLPARRSPAGRRARRR